MHHLRHSRYDYEQKKHFHPGMFALIAHCAYADFIISPRLPIAVSGNGPFFVFQSDARSVRFQEVHAASDFSSVVGPVFISEFSLWRAAGSLPIDLTLSSVAMHFSTTITGPHQLSRTFADNVGSDETAVFSGPLRLFDSGGEFGISIPLQTPFYYDPERGNLLMDIWNYNTAPHPSGGTYGIEWQGTFSESVGGLSSLDAAATIGNTYGGGMIIRFTVTPVPEPSSWLLLAFSGAVLAAFRWSSSIKKKEKHESMKGSPMGAIGQVGSAEDGVSEEVERANDCLH
jgi:hypothetical protein